MLTKEHFIILPNRSQAKKEIKTRTFFLSNYSKTLEPYHVPIVLRVQEQACANRGIRRGRGERGNIEESRSLGRVRVCGFLPGRASVVLLDTPAVITGHHGGGSDEPSRPHSAPKSLGLPSL